MMKQELKTIITGIKTIEDANKAAAILMYRVNKSVKYIQADNAGFTLRFYRLKQKYIQYFIESGFLVERNSEQDNMVLRFSVAGIELKFHQVNPKKLRFSNTIDTSKPTEEINSYIKDIVIMYKMLISIGNFLKLK